MTLPLPAPQDYTDKDYSAIRVRIQTLITAAFPAWTEFERSRLENVFIDAFAHMMDVATFYQDRFARETRFGTAALRRSMIELCRLIDYDLDTQTAAVTDVIFSIPVAAAGNVNIPTGTTTKSLGTGANVVRFQSTAPATIVAGLTDSAATAVEHSEQQSDTFTATGDVSEEFKLSVRPFLDGSESMLIAAVPWTKVDHFLDSGAADLHYTLRVDEYDHAFIKLGDGINGAQAAPGAAVAISYKSGGGDDGNVDATAIKKVEGGPWYDVLGNQVSLSCNNAAAAVGGLDRETVDEARVRAPRSLRVLNRCVARTDFEDLSIQVSGVGRALALSSNEDATVPEGQVKVWIIPDGGGAAPAALLTAVETYINTNFPTPVVCTWSALAATYVTMNIKVWAYLEEGAVIADVVTAVRAALTTLLAPVDASGDPNELINFGYYYQDAAGAYEGEFPLDLVERTIGAVSGVRRLGTSNDVKGIQINGQEDDVSLTIREFPEAGNLQLVNGDTGADYYNGAI